MLGFVLCPAHGERAPAFVCKHLLGGTGLGFVEPIGEQAPDASDELAAWCHDCEAVRQQHCGWNDKSEAFAEVTMVCSGCFESARSRNAY